MLCDLYPAAFMTELYAPQLTFQTKVIAPLLSAMETENPLYMQWIQNRPDRNAITWKDIENYASEDLTCQKCMTWALKDVLH